MKFIIAIIKPQKLEAVRAALNALGIAGMTVTEVRGYGRQKGHREVYRGAEYQVEFIPKVKVEIAVPANIARRAVDAIALAAHGGAIGDGKIFVLNLEEAVRVRTGETGADAL